MAIPFYLAMTAAEKENAEVLPACCGWMACHFSLSSRGLTNLPVTLPAGTLLMLDDANPVSGHDPALVAEQLREVAERFSCAGILLDFQRPVTAEEVHMVQGIVEALPGQVVASAPYGGEPGCPVCLPPVPCSVPLPEYLASWESGQIWLEGALTVERWEITREGAKRREVRGKIPPQQGFRDAQLHCHYAVNPDEDCLYVTLWRDREDLKTLWEEAEDCGVKAMVGLWQELGNFL